MAWLVIFLLLIVFAAVFVAVLRVSSDMSNGKRTSAQNKIISKPAGYVLCKKMQRVYPIFLTKLRRE